MVRVKDPLILTDLVESRVVISRFPLSHMNFSFPFFAEFIFLRSDMITIIISDERWSQINKNMQLSLNLRICPSQSNILIHKYKFPSNLRNKKSLKLLEILCDLCDFSTINTELNSSQNAKPKSLKTSIYDIWKPRKNKITKLKLNVVNTRPLAWFNLRVVSRLSPKFRLQKVDSVQGHSLRHDYMIVFVEISLSKSEKWIRHNLQKSHANIANK